MFGNGGAEAAFDGAGDEGAREDSLEEDEECAGSGRVGGGFSFGEIEEAAPDDGMGRDGVAEGAGVETCDLAEFGLGGSGAEGTDVDAVLADFRIEGFAEETVKGLGGGVGGHIGDGLEGCGGGEHHDVSAAALDHVREEEMGEMDDGGAVDGDHFPVPVWGAVVKLAEVAEAGVVDEDVDGDSGGFCGVVELLGRVGESEVGGEDADLDGEPGADAIGEGFEAIGAAGGEDEVSAGGGEVEGDVLSETCGGSGDEGPLTGEGACERGVGGVRSHTRISLLEARGRRVTGGGRGEEKGLRAAVGRGHGFAGLEGGDVAGLLEGVADAVNDGDGGEGGEDPEYGGHGVPAHEEGAEDDEDDAFGALHESDLAFSDQGLGPGAGVADHEGGDHDEGGESDEEEAVSAGVKDEQSEEEDDVGVAVDDGVKEGTEDGDLLGLSCDASIDHVEDAGADDDDSGIEEHADVVVGIGEAEEYGCADVDDESDEGEGVG